MTRVTSPMPKLSNAFQQVAMRASPSTARTSASASSIALRYSSSSSNKRSTPSDSQALASQKAFHTFHPQQAAHDASSIDYFIMPSVSSFDDSVSFTQYGNPAPHVTLRVPLLPDNYNPDRSAFHAVEAEDTAVPRPEIMVVADELNEHVAHKSGVVSAMTEVVGDLGAEISVESIIGREKTEKTEDNVGTIKSLFSSMLDDVLGPKGGRPSPA